jgi:hypothetical protein
MDMSGVMILNFVARKRWSTYAVQEMRIVEITYSYYYEHWVSLSGGGFSMQRLVL